MQSRIAFRKFASSDGDHVTLLNVFRASNDFFEKNKQVSNEKSEKNLRRWCKENFINNRSLKQARDIHRFVYEFKFLFVSHCFVYELKVLFISHNIY